MRMMGGGNIKFIPRSRILRKIHSEEMMEGGNQHVGVVTDGSLKRDRGLKVDQKEGKGGDNRKLHLWDQKKRIPKILVKGLKKSKFFMGVFMRIMWLKYFVVISVNLK